jgi:hypothetical protein
MIRLESGDDLVFSSFVINDEEFTPDAGVVRVRLRNREGVVTYDDSPAFDNYIVIPESEFGVIPAEDANVMFSLILDFQSEGRDRVIREFIRVEKHTFIFVTPENVRAVLGVTENELPDNDIDLYSRYYAINQSLGVDVLDAAYDAKDGNELILYEEALRQTLFLELKLLKSFNIDDIRKSRLGTFDFQALRDRFETLIRELRVKFNEEEVLPTTPLLSVVARTDPFSGA